MKYNFKPNDGDYPVFYKGYMDTLEDKPLLETLKEEKKFALDIFKSIPEEKADYAYDEGKWTIKEVLLHILDTELVFTYRGIAIARGEKQSLPGFDQDEYMQFINSENLILKDLVESFEHIRSLNILLFGMLSEDDLARIGTASGYQVSAKALGYFVAGHCRYHALILKDRYGI